MGKKKAEEMARERVRFLDGAGKQGIRAELAGEIFDQMETFAAYGFNKSHSAAYALVSYQTAYLKAHHPQEFMAALLTMEMGDTDKTYKNIADCRERGIRILPPTSIRAAKNSRRRRGTSASASAPYAESAVRRSRRSSRRARRRSRPSRTSAGVCGDRSSTSGWSRALSSAALSTR